MTAFEQGTDMTDGSFTAMGVQRGLSWGRVTKSQVWTLIGGESEEGAWEGARSAGLVGHRSRILIIGSEAGFRAENDILKSEPWDVGKILEPVWEMNLIISELF